MQTTPSSPVRQALHALVVASDPSHPDHAAFWEAEYEAAAANELPADSERVMARLWDQARSALRTSEGDKLRPPLSIRFLDWARGRRDATVRGFAAHLAEQSA